MLTLKQIRTALRDRRLSLVSQETGLHVNTIAYIRDGIAANPSHDTVVKLSEYIESTLPEQDKGAR